MELPKKDKIEIIETTIKMLLYRFTMTHYPIIPWLELDRMGLTGWPIDIPIMDLNNLNKKELIALCDHIHEIGFKRPHYKTTVLESMLASKLEEAYGPGVKISHWAELIEVYHLKGWPSNVPYKRLNDLTEDQLDILFYSMNEISFSKMSTSMNEKVHNVSLVQKQLQ